MDAMKKMVDRFLAWPLPESVSADECTTNSGTFMRHGTNLLTANEAQQMLEHLGVADLLACLEAFTALVPEPEMVSMGYDLPPEYRTLEEGELAYALYRARKVLAG